MSSHPTIHAALDFGVPIGDLRVVRYVAPPPDPIEAAVTAGMNVLDRVRGPGWIDDVDLDTLDILDTEDCVLGQLYGEFSIGLVAVAPPNRGRHHRRTWALAHGFNTVLTYSSPGFNSLTSEWRRQITARRDSRKA